MSFTEQHKMELDALSKNVNPWVPFIYFYMDLPVGLEYKINLKLINT